MMFQIADEKQTVSVFLEIRLTLTLRTRKRRRRKEEKKKSVFFSFVVALIVD
jgi:hypothetical protein